MSEYLGNVKVDGGAVEVKTGNIRWVLLLNDEVRAVSAKDFHTTREADDDLKDFMRLLVTPPYSEEE